MTPVHPKRASGAVPPAAFGTPAMDVERAIVVSVPGKRVFNVDDSRQVATSLACWVDNTRLIAAGEPGLSVGQSVKQGLMDALAAAPQERMLVFLDAHGEVVNGRLCVCLDGDEWLPVDDLFRAIAAHHEGPVELWMTACHGGLGQKHVDLLPPGSVLVALAEGNQVVSASAVNRLRDCLPLLRGVNAFGMLLCFCATSLKSIMHPSISVSGGGSRDLDAGLRWYKGKVLTKEHERLVHEQLDGLVGPDRVNEVIGRIEDHQAAIWSADYGLALAVVAVLMGVMSLPSGHPVRVDELVACPPDTVPLGLTLNTNLPSLSRMFRERGRTQLLEGRVCGRWDALLPVLRFQVGERNVTLRFSGQPLAPDFKLIALDGPSFAVEELLEAGILEDPSNPRVARLSDGNPALSPAQFVPYTSPGGNPVIQKF
jgi:hypothetical protein